MRLSSFFIVLCLCILQCNGVPPKEDATESSAGSATFTKAEDDFIIEERLRVPVYLPTVEKNFWIKLADKHREKWLQNTPGFHKERSRDSLRARYRRLKDYHNPKSSVKKSKEVLQRFGRDLNSSPRAPRVHFTSNEEKFLIEEISNMSTNPSSRSTSEAILGKHNELRNAGAPGFENERTAGGLRSHIYRMHRKGQLPDETVRKLLAFETGAGSSNPTPSNQETFFQLMGEDEDEGQDED